MRLFKRENHHKDSCQWTYKENNHNVSGQTSSDKPVVTTPTVKKSMVNTEEQFGSWMIAGRSRRGGTSRGRNQSMRVMETGRGVRMSQGNRGERMASGFSVLADIGEEDESTVAAGKGSESQQGMDKGKTLRIEESEGKSNQSLVGPKVWQKKGKNEKIGKNNTIGPREVKEAQLVKNTHGQDAVGQKKGNGGVGPSKTSMGRREHVIVGGNIAQTHSQPIGAVNQGKKQ